MGLTNSSIGIKAVDSGLDIKKKTGEEYIVAIAGNPNVGKSTLFNAITGMNQHTGNWPGKTVSNAQGYCRTKENSYIMVDIPGTYSLMAHSAEEEVARNFICFGKPDAVVVVCDATCLERNLNLVLQTMELSDQVLVCVNLLDEAERKEIIIDLEGLSNRLGVPVIGTIARKKKSLDGFLKVLDQLVSGQTKTKPMQISYGETLEEAVLVLESVIRKKTGGTLRARWLALRLLEQDEALLKEADQYLGMDIRSGEEMKEAKEHAERILQENNMGENECKDVIVSSFVKAAEQLAGETVLFKKRNYNAADRKLDRILTSRKTGYPVMIALLALVFWLTITGSNYPSQLLSEGLFFVQDRLTELFQFLHAPDWLHGMLVLGVYRVLAWVVSVMLPPMAIFFPLFTLLEDVGYLPRVAYNLDKPFQRCCACGKQSLTACMVNVNL